jgi:hypothetical protein
MMTVSRRGFLKSGTMLALFTSVPAGFATTVLGRDTRIRFDFRQADFEPCLNSTFRVHTGLGSTVELKLVKITDLRRAINKEEREAFSLLFESPTAAKLPQDTYLFEHRRLGQLSFFTVPVGRRKVARYEVIVNRI